MLQNLQLECCGTFRFSDHRSLRPGDVLLDSEGFVARLSKTIGSDRAVTVRWAIISTGAFVQSSSWMATGWELLGQEAAFDRDCQLPSPADGFRGCRHKELKCVIGSAVQFRVLWSTISSYSATKSLSTWRLTAGGIFYFQRLWRWGTRRRQGSARGMVGQCQ